MNAPANNVIELYTRDNRHFVALGELMLSYYEDRPKCMNAISLSGKINPDELARQGFVQLAEDAKQIVYGRGAIAVIYSKSNNSTAYHPKLFPESCLGQEIDVSA